MCCAIFVILMKDAEISNILITTGFAILLIVSIYMLAEMSRNDIPIGAVIVVLMCIAVVATTLIISLFYGNFLGTVLLGTGLYLVFEAIRRGISIGIIFAICVGIIVIVTTMNSIIFNEGSVDITRILFMCLVIGSMIGIWTSYSEKCEKKIKQKL